eukprot:4406933-Amphidinium_carterae.1
MPGGMPACSVGGCWGMPGCGGTGGPTPAKLGGALICLRLLARSQSTSLLLSHWKSFQMRSTKARHHIHRRRQAWHVMWLFEKLKH